MRELTKRCVHREHVGKRYLPRAAFYREDRYRDGLHPYCRVCKRRDMNERNRQQRELLFEPEQSVSAVIQRKQSVRSKRSSKATERRWRIA